jgi:hypothetical protein
MDDLFGEDEFDIIGPEGLVLIAGLGLLDGDERCACWCPCERTVDWAGECDACREGRHRDAFDQQDRR